ncbi:methylamine utilization protein [Idiomarina tyrosinivorans]|uniref:Methylamine utilization protein n=1 Tax=Idiomarina tyrosinivorans TaxID=1445662 RepID=A0A432ZRD4_9GAMM|nr:methylamine utilization protein [Idiomarina tyrosinivorans]RUO80467.1 methylamine utilization protein [Idiomarina tyrosinivorans]
MISLRLVATLAAGVVISTSAVAETLKINVVDPQHKPLADAVVAWEQAPTSAKPQAAVMDQVNKQFAPHVLIVNRGSKVTFPNSDNIRHHVYSFSPTQPFELKLYSDKKRPALRFEHSGVVTLGCNIHDTMIGYLYVTTSPYAQLTDAEGMAELTLPSMPQQLTVWHSGMAEKPITVDLSQHPERPIVIELPVKQVEKQDDEPSRLEKRFNRLERS